MIEANLPLKKSHEARPPIEAFRSKETFVDMKRLWKNK